MKDECVCIRAGYRSKMFDTDTDTDTLTSIPVPERYLFRYQYYVTSFINIILPTFLFYFSVDFFTLIFWVCKKAPMLKFSMFPNNLTTRFLYFNEFIHWNTLHYHLPDNECIEMLEMHYIITLIITDHHSNCNLETWISVKLLWNDMYCEKCYTNKCELN